MKFSTIIALVASVASVAAAPVKSANQKEGHKKDHKEESSANGNVTILDTDAPFGIKKGLAYNDGNAIRPLSRQNSATWAYNWGPALNAPQFQGIPMCWGGRGDCNANGIMQKIDRGDTPWVLGYNEPDFPREYGGSAMSPQQAYDSWGNDMFKFAERGARLVCPGISSYDTSQSKFTGIASGLTWLRQWARTKNTPGEFRCDAQALHWYGEAGKSGAEQGRLMIDYLSRAHGTVNDIFRREMDIWVTEFSPEPRGDVNLLADFLRTVIPWMNAQPWIARYAPFKAEYLVNGNGQLNAAGQAFVNTM